MWPISNPLTWLKCWRLRKNLLGLPPRTLADIGISAELLADGIRAWPWLTPAEDLAPLTFANLGRTVAEPDYAAAIAELEACSDADLLDLGLTRGGIEDAVRNGRPGFPEERRAA
jgi:uncharacterized protein YjiS (DUF1127 family)